MTQAGLIQSFMKHFGYKSSKPENIYLHPLSFSWRPGQGKFPNCQIRWLSFGINGNFFFSYRLDLNHYVTDCGFCYRLDLNHYVTDCGFRYRLDLNHYVADCGFGYRLDLNHYVADCGFGYRLDLNHYVTHCGCKTQNCSKS